ncbi:MAG: hypothetical protein AAF934_07380 [Bacteroidota bacterium]
MRLSIFKLRKNRRFNYTPRYYQGKDIGNIYDFDSKFTKYRETSNAIDFGSHWRAARAASRNRGNRVINKRLVLIIAVLALIFLYVIDFDLSIFTQNN